MKLSFRGQAEESQGDPSLITRDDVKTMRDVTYKKFVRRWEEVMDLPPQTLGPFTKPYKKLTRRLKVMPWPWLILVSILIVVGLYVLVGSAITLLVTLLQRGF